MGRFRARMARFMYGRYGMDRLYHVLFLTAIALMIASFFIKHWIVSALELIVLFYMMFRFFSRNIYKRQRENQAFCRFFERIGARFKLGKTKFRDRKTHVFRKCPRCRSQLRLPRSKGRHTVCCPRCQNRFDVKI